MQLPDIPRGSSQIVRGGLSSAAHNLITPTTETEMKSPSSTATESRWRDLLNVLASAAIGLAAIVLTGSIAYRTFVPGARSPAPELPNRIPFWQEALQVGIPMGGDRDAPVKLFVLSDLECPACRGFHETVRTVVAERPQHVQAIYVPYPLGFHRFALPAARAADCSERTGSFNRWIDVVYAKQDSLGIKSWGSYAMEAGISDTTRIAKCAKDANTKFPRIEAGIAFGNQLGRIGTPTILANEWQLATVPDVAFLRRAIDAILQGQKLDSRAFLSRRAPDAPAAQR